MTEQTQPTDAEILGAAEDFRSQYTHGGTTFDEFDEIGFARAVLAKWGTPAPVGVEPVKRQYYYRVDGCPAVDSESPGCICWHDEGAGPRATADPTLVSWRSADQVPAMGRVPLTHAQAKALVSRYGNDPLHLVYQVEVAHGIKGGQHGTE